MLPVRSSMPITRAPLSVAAVIDSQWRKANLLAQHRDLVCDPDATGIVVVRVAAVGGGSDRNSPLVRLAHGRTQRPHHRLRAQLQRDVLGRVALRIAERTHHGQRRHEVRAAALHFVERRVVDPGAVLDAANTRAHRGCRPRTRVGMCRDVQALLCRFRDGRTDLVFGEFLLARVGAGEAGAFTGTDLDHVGTLRNQCASRLGDAIRAAQLTVDRVAELRVDLVEGDAGLRPDVTWRDEQLGPWHVPGSNEVTRPQRLQVRVAQHARGGHARLQCPQRRRWRLDVRMRVDQSRQQVTPAKVDLPHAARCGRCPVDDRRNLAATDGDRESLAWSGTRAIDQRDVEQVEILRRHRLRAGKHARAQAADDDGCDQDPAPRNDHAATPRVRTAPTLYRNAVPGRRALRDFRAADRCRVPGGNAGSGFPGSCQAGPDPCRMPAGLPARRACCSCPGR